MNSLFSRSSAQFQAENLSQMTFDPLNVFILQTENLVVLTFFFFFTFSQNVSATFPLSTVLCVVVVPTVCQWRAIQVTD